MRIYRGTGSCVGVDGSMAIARAKNDLRAMAMDVERAVGRLGQGDMLFWVFICYMSQMRGLQVHFHRLSKGHKPSYILRRKILKSIGNAYRS